jgi:acetone carboxylase gamma subunit
LRTLRYEHKLEDNVFILLVPMGFQAQTVEIQANSENLFLPSTMDWRDEVMSCDPGVFVELDPDELIFQAQPGYVIKAWKQTWALSAVIDVADEVSDEQLLDQAEMGYLDFSASDGIEILDSEGLSADWLYPIE